MIGTYPSTSSGLISVAEDGDLNPIFKIELDAALGEDLEVDLSFLGSAVFGGNYTVATQDPAAPTGTVLPNNTSTCYFVYPDNPNSPAANIPAGMAPCGSVVIPKGKTYVEVQVVQQVAAPRPTGNSTVKIELLSGDRYEVDIDTATATISPRIGRYTYSNSFFDYSLPTCADPNPGYTLASQTYDKYTIYEYTKPNTGVFPFNLVEYRLVVKNGIYYQKSQLSRLVYFTPILGGVEYGGQYYAYDGIIDPPTTLAGDRADLASRGYSEMAIDFYEGACNYIEI